MRRDLRPIVGMLLIASTTVTGQETPAKQFRSLLKEYNSAAGAFRRAKNDQQRKQAVVQIGKFARKFLDLADKHPKDPTALRALRQATQAIGSTDSAAQNAWEINTSHFPNDQNDGSVQRLVRIVQRDHLKSDKIGPIIDRMRYGYRLEFAECLELIHRTTPHRTIRGLAVLALARNLKDRLRMLQLAKDRAELTKRYARTFGRDYLRNLQRANLAKRIEPLLQLAMKYHNVKMPYGGTVAQQAKSELFEMKVLGVGKPAPEIVGRDQDDKPFKLSDYRGKTVLLYFWVQF